jgi:predicted acyl esterase
MRGTGCSGGSFRFFELAQSIDGFDVIEAIAAQPWVLDNEVGMVGISYPGISQLFVAATQPPSLNSITPLSVLADSYRSTLYPGGILNTGFAVEWTQQRVDQSKPYGQGWEQAMVDDGDDECEQNQSLRGQNPDLVAEIDENPFYANPLGDSLAPITFVDRIEVPVFLAGAWQDEQTGGHFPHSLDRFTSSPHLYATMVNGLHTESISLGILTEYIEFLQLYVAKIAPDLTLARFAAPLLASGLTGVDGLTLPPSDLEGLSYEDALAAFEARPAIRVLFEQGAAEGTPPASPLPRFEARFESWPVPAAVARSWYLTEGERLADQPPLGDAPAASYLADPDAVPATWYSGSSSAIWRADVSYDWVPIPDANAATWTSPPLLDDTVVVGEGTVQLFLRSSAADTDLEVTLSELRPDGTETYVQSGWLRASRRAFDADASTETITVQRHLEADAEELPPGEFAEVRVPIFPVAQAFRAGSQLKLTVAAPGGNRPVWVFDTLAGGEKNEIAQTAGLASRLILPVVPGVEVPAGVPACGALRGQPCRPTP